VCYDTQWYLTTTSSGKYNSTWVLYTDMSKLAFLTMATLAAAILSLSVLFAYAYASEGDATKSALNAIHHGTSPTTHPTDVGTEPKKFQPDKGFVPPRIDSGSTSHHHGKIGKINRLFRSDSIGNTGSSALDNIPVIQPLFNNSTNTTSSTTTATVTIPVCDGILPGPCLDKTTGQIIP
jgi:hypothetical protein